MKNLWPASNGSSQKKMAAAKNVRNRGPAKFDRKSVPTSFHRFLCFCFTLFHKKPSTAAQQADRKSVKLFTGDRVFLKGSKTADFSLRFRFKRLKKIKENHFLELFKAGASRASRARANPAHNWSFSYLTKQKIWHRERERSAAAAAAAGDDDNNDDNNDVDTDADGHNVDGNNEELERERERETDKNEKLKQKWF